MNKKDYVYLALIAFSGVVFYFHGLYAGVRRSKKLFQTFLEHKHASLDADLPSEHEETADADFALIRGRRAVFPRSVIRGVFGKN